MLRTYILFFSLFFFCMGILSGTSAQNTSFQILPYYQPYLKATEKPNIPFAHVEVPIELPFFDDFSTIPNQSDPDKNFWVENGGSIVNHNVAVNPISVGVVTLDGVDALGNPYQLSDVVQSAIGLADELVSHSINLGGLTIANNVFLSFYWQKEGRSERPDERDSLRLQFQDDANEWITVWSIKGGGPTNDFTQVLVKVANQNFFHEAFRFRFQSYGRLSGIYDVWNLDYVYLNKNRNAQDIYVPQDVTCSNTPPKLLKRYSAMPVNQFLVNPTNQVNTEIFTLLNNLGDPALRPPNLSFDQYDYGVEVEDKISNTIIYQSALTSAFIDRGLSATARQVPATVTIPNNIIPLADSLRLKTSFIINAQDDDLAIAGYNLKRNDTVSSMTVLKDYYAYDDGSAEYVALSMLKEAE
jgi:hypothetical protein